MKGNSGRKSGAGYEARQNRKAAAGALRRGDLSVAARAGLRVDDLFAGDRPISAGAIIFLDRYDAGSFSRDAIGERRAFVDGAVCLDENVPIHFRGEIVV